MIVVRRYVVPEADPVMHSLQSLSVAMQLICVDEVLEALPRKWCLKKTGSPEKNGRRSRGSNEAVPPEGVRIPLVSRSLLNPDV
jgi:hypothetical protein